MHTLHNLSNKRRWFMSSSRCRQRPVQAVLVALALLVVVGVTGCQVDVGGQTLPSAYYMFDDIQYFPPGPEFPLSREAAAIKAATQAEELRR